MIKAFIKGVAFACFMIMIAFALAFLVTHKRRADIEARTLYYQEGGGKVESVVVPKFTADYSAGTQITNSTNIVITGGTYSSSTNGMNWAVEFQQTTNSIWYIGIPHTDNIWKVRARNRLEAIASIHASVWREEEWNDALTNQTTRNYFDKIIKDDLLVDYTTNAP